MKPESPARTDAVSDLAGVARLGAELAQATAAGLAGLLWLAAAVLLWRRLAGALARPLDASALMLVSVLVAGAVAAVRIAGRYRVSEQAGVPGGRLVAASLSGAAVGIGVASSLPGTPTAGLIVFWGLVAVEESWAWAPPGWRRLRRARRRSPAARPEAPIKEPPSPGTGRVGLGLESDGPPASDVTQQLTRRRGADGSEALTGWLRVPMAAGQRSASVHVAFCPPFLRTPAVTAQQLDGPEARIKKVQVFPYGARFDVKLAAVGESPATVLLQFSAQGGPPVGQSAQGIEAKDRSAESCSDT